MFSRRPTTILSLVTARHRILAPALQGRGAATTTSTATAASNTKASKAPLVESTERLPMDEPASVVIPTCLESPDPIVPKRWTTVEKRTGVLAVKKGMLGMWDPWGQRVPVTVLQLEDTYVLGNKTQSRDGYDAVVVGCREKLLRTAEERKSERLAIGWCGRARIGKLLTRLAEFRVSPNGHLPVRTKLSAAHFVPGQFVDVVGTSKDKGFQGVMKRWGFKGQPQSHGTSLSHRSPGSIGNRKDPGKVFKGKKMAGHMGNESVTVRSLQVLKVDRALDLVYVKGSVPGPKESIVRITDALFQQTAQFDPYANPPPFPTRTREELEALPVEQELCPKPNEIDPIAKQLQMA